MYICITNLPNKRRKYNMTQILIQIEDTTLLSSIKKVLKSIQGVSIKEIQESKPNFDTLKAMSEAKNGKKVIRCTSTKDLIKKLNA